MAESHEKPDPFALRPYVGLSLAYVGIFGHLGIVMPAFALWIDGRGYGTMAIGMLLALPALAKMATPWTWGKWSDRHGSTTRWMIVAAILSTLALLCFPLERSLPVLFVLMAIYGFCRAPLLPLLEATALRWSAGGAFRYGPVRLWGSLAFAATSILFGLLWAAGVRDGILWVAAGGLVLCGGTARLMLAGGPTSSPPSERRGFEPWAARERRLFFLVCALMQASHAAYYGFYSLHLTRAGYDGSDIGILWALAIVAEVIVLFRLDRWVDRIGTVSMMRFALLVAAARWVWIGFASHWWEFAAAQLLHAATYAVFHVAAIHHVDRGFGVARRTQAQALYSGVSFGLGLSMGSLIVGWAASHWGLPLVFRGAAVVPLLAVLLLSLSRGRGPADASG
ncbi:MAG: MFS transporter [Acidobacteriota bacterium]|nr:MFS transporter [Acidobacteriota bacterium]MDH3784756.1 MFS transporter [Acidobacteriota bacterium]